MIITNRRIWNSDKSHDDALICLFADVTYKYRLLSSDSLANEKRP